MRVLETILLAGVLVSGLHGQGDWPAYAYNQSGQRYSPLTQLNAKNVSNLKLAWQYGVDPRSVDLNPATRALTATEAVPIVAAGILYTPTVQHSIVALEPETGTEIWKFDLGKVGAPLRGEDYAHYRRGEASAVSTAVEDVTGRPPSSFGQFVQDYRQAFLQ